VLFVFDLEQALALRLERRLPVGTCETPVNEEAVTDGTDSGHSCEIPIPRVEGAGEEETGCRRSDVTIAAQPEDLGVEQMDAIVGR
jgi:hypothetical protein